MGNAGAPDKKEKAVADGQAQGGPQRRGGKSDAAFRTISEVATELDVPQHVLRFWETKFSQIRPMKRGGGRRYYRPEDVVLLTTIRDLLYREGYTIKGVQKLLRDNGAKAVVHALQDRAEDEAGALTLVGMAAAHDAVTDDGRKVGPDDAFGTAQSEETAWTDEELDPETNAAMGAVESPAMGGLELDRGEDDDAEDLDGGDYPSGMTAAHRQEIESILEELVALRSLMGQALDATRPPPAPLD